MHLDEAWEENNWFYKFWAFASVPLYEWVTFLFFTCVVILLIAAAALWAFTTCFGIELKHDDKIENSKKTE